MRSLTLVKGETFQMPHREMVVNQISLQTSSAASNWQDDEIKYHPMQTVARQQRLLVGTMLPHKLHLMCMIEIPWNTWCKWALSAEKREENIKTVLSKNCVLTTCYKVLIFQEHYLNGLRENIVT